MSKTATARTNRIRNRMRRARALAIATGGGVHVRKVWPTRAKPAAAETAKQA